MGTTRWCMLVGLAVIVLSAWGERLRAEEEPEEIVARLKSKAESVQSGRADLKMTMSMMGQKVSMSGTMLFQKPRRSRTEITMNLGALKLEQIVIADGTTVWTYQPTMKMVTRIDLQKLTAATGMEKAAQKNSDIAQPFQGLQSESIRLLRTEEKDGKKVYVLEGTPDTSELPDFPFKPAKIQIWVGDESGLLQKMVMLDAQGNEMMSQIYENIEVNVDVPAEQFEFTPPEGVQVMDMTEGTINMLKTMKKPEE